MEDGASREGPPDGGRTEAFVEEWRSAAYNCFSSGHKFCREVCPVMQVTRDEAHTPTAFHANVVAHGAGHARTSRTSPATTSTAPSAGPASCAARTPSSPGTSTASARARWTWSRRCAALAVDAGIHQPGWQEWNRLTDERRHEPVLNGTPVDQAHVADWARGARAPGGRRDRALLRLRGRLPPHLHAARARPHPGGRRRGVRPHARAVVLRRPGGRDGLRGAGAALRRAQRGRLARERHQADHRDRPPRLHLLHRGLPAVLRRRPRLRVRAGGGAGGRAGARGPAAADRADRAGRDLPRRLPAQQAQGHPRGAAGDPPRDPGPDLQGRGPRHPVVLLLGRRARGFRSSGPTSPPRSAGGAWSEPRPSRWTRW